MIQVCEKYYMTFSSQVLQVQFQAIVKNNQ
jgi:hypothetical protein